MVTDDAADRVTAARSPTVGSLTWGFATLGATGSVIPAALPAMTTAVGGAPNGLLPAVPALFLGLLMGVLAAPWVTVSTSLVTAVRGGAVTCAGGVSVCGIATESTAFVIGAGLAGLGFGLVEASGAAAARGVGADRAASVLTRLTLSVAVAATATPLLVVGCGAIGLPRLAFGIVAALGLSVALLSRGGPFGPVPSDPGPVPPRADGATDTTRRRRDAALGVALFGYVGAETVLSGWSSTTVATVLNSGDAVSALGTSAFWLLMSAGRLAGSAALRRWASGRVSVVGTGVLAALLGIAAAVAATRPVVTAVVLGAAILAAAPCYALLLSAAAGAAHGRAVPATSRLIAIGATGGVAVSAVAAVVSPAGPGAPLAVAAGAAAVAFLVILLFRSPASLSRP